MKNIIMFRTDANPKIGAGHLTRCITIADELKKAGVASLFVLSDDCSIADVKASGHISRKLKPACFSLEKQTEHLAAIAQELNPIALVTDSYAVTLEYFNAVKGCCKSVYIDDLHAFNYPVDTIINYNIYAEDLDYSYCGNTIIGAAFAPLRPQFRELIAVNRPTAKNVFISTGGADLYGIGVKLLEKLCADTRLKALSFNIVVGALSPHFKKINELAGIFKSLKIHQNVTEMAALMQSCDFAVSAAGSTLYELCAAGVPTVCYTLADNQLMGAEAFESRGLMLGAGDFRGGEQLFLNKAADKLHELACNKALREKMQLKMQATVDGYGAKRICELLLK